MLICIQTYQLAIKNFGNENTSITQTNENLVGNVGGLNIEVVLVIDFLHVISFDRFAMKLPSSVQYDDQVRVHLNYMRHHN